MNKEFWAEHYPDNIDWTIMGFTADELRAMDPQPERQELREAGIGCQIGAGRGSEYYFFDLALKDIDAAVDIMQRLTLVNDLPNETWLKFYDAADKTRSIGLHIEAPAGV
ncbi:MAG: hypothetical protein SFY67_02025 [Candidatus Melainabacteria bacterium]|nr:hypothetical protein [Candidatus Melainabacteria bacterium]